MQSVLLSFLMGCVVGVAYGLVNVRSPAPPIIALIGLLGIVMGEQAVIRARDRWPTAPWQAWHAPAPRASADKAATRQRLPNPPP
jgi:XapX domain-containing protein